MLEHGAADLECAVEELRSALGAGGVLLPGEGLERYEKDFLSGHRGRAAFVVRPRTTHDVRTVLRCAYRHRFVVVPQGANTGTALGAIPDESGRQCVMSLELCRERLEIDVVNRSLTASAGHDLDSLNAELASHDLFLPVDLGCSPTVGGMVATNTGGAKVLGYGDVRRRVLGVEVVLANEDATVVSSLAGLRKNNNGLDLKQLFIGTCGTFGVVTAATFELARRPVGTATAWVSLRDDEAALRLLGQLEAEVAEVLTSFEVAPRAMFEVAHRHGLAIPFRRGRLPHIAALVELSSSASDGSALENRLVRILDGLSGAGGPVCDAVFGRPAEMWAVRHGIVEPNMREGYTFFADVAVARSRIAVFRRALDHLLERRAPGWLCYSFGHYGDGGLHVVVLWPFVHGTPPDARSWEELRRAIYALVVEHGGTFNAEHPLGPSNEEHYRQHTDPSILRLCSELKRIVDPRGILGNVNLGLAPGAVADPARQRIDENVLRTKEDAHVS